MYAVKQLSIVILSLTKKIYKKIWSLMLILVSVSVTLLTIDTFNNKFVSFKRYMTVRYIEVIALRMFCRISVLSIVPN